MQFNMQCNLICIGMQCLSLHLSLLSTLKPWYDSSIISHVTITVRHHACLCRCLCDEQVLFAAGLALAFGLDNWAGNTTDYEISKLTIFGIFIAYIYSAPPLKLKVHTVGTPFTFSFSLMIWFCDESFDPIYHAILFIMRWCSVV